MLFMMLSMLTTKCMLGTKCKWSEDWQIEKEMETIDEKV
jgi:hypothetical protein